MHLVIYSFLKHITEFCFIGLNVNEIQSIGFRGTKGKQTFLYFWWWLKLFFFYLDRKNTAL